MLITDDGCVAEQYKGEIRCAESFMGVKLELIEKTFEEDSFILVPPIGMATKKYSLFKFPKALNVVWRDHFIRTIAYKIILDFESEETGSLYYWGYR